MLLDSNPELLKNLKIYLNDPEDFTIYLTDTPEHILEVILPHISELLKSNIQQLPAMLGMLTPSKLDIIIQQSQNIITNVYTFYTIYIGLSTAQKKQLIEFFQGHWQDLIQGPYDFKAIYETLPEEEQKKQLIEIFQGQWEYLIKTGFDFNVIYETLPKEEQKNQLIESFQGHWRDLIKNRYDFEVIYKELPEKNQSQLIQSFQGHWRDLIK
ncbi:MAG: hypothetical protein EBZ58_12835, partial [Bacteroidetes bacterium]|nr:hypothetical protein [Bacteroidota bacterium]